MRYKGVVFLMVWVILVFSICNALADVDSERLRMRAQQLFKPIPEKMEEIPYKGVKLTKELIEL